MKIIQANELTNTFFEPRKMGDAQETAKNIINSVQKNGDTALRDFSRQFDQAAPAKLEISETDMKAAADNLQKANPKLYNALKYSSKLALKFAKRQAQSFENFEMEIAPGLFTSQKTIPVERAGVYVPAGQFPLISSVIMTTSPAIAAGVKEIVFCTPPRIHPDDIEKAHASSPFVGGKPYADSTILATAYICGLRKAYAVGGAQAIAAMAYGTETIPSVDVIAGPGNKYVTDAKKQVFGKVGIDILAGPTEVFIIADSSANPKWIAADLLAQAEHDVLAQAIVATTDTNLAKQISVEIEKQLQTLSTAEIARKSIDNHGLIIITKTLKEAAEIANRKAPEHLELAMKAGPIRNKIEKQVHNYGSLFIGHDVAEVFGDYAAGLNHTLPTSGAARYTGGLSVRCFLKTCTSLRAKKNNDGSIKTGTKKTSQASVLIAEAEGLMAHANAAKIRQ
ncbi:MAG TPA: histidinol dehydrogenase [Treponemataceae bacterium]|nr:histidinol dehydrogenase [Treponemataceae bacterium]